MHRKKIALDISLAENRDARRVNQEAKKLNQENAKDIKKRRNIISAVLFSFALGAGSGLIFTNVKVPIDGPESPEIPVFQKLKYDVNDGIDYLMDSIYSNDTDKNENKIEPQEEYQDKSKIRIEIPTDTDCGPDNVKGCRIS